MSLLNPSYLQAGRLQQEIQRVQEKLKRDRVEGKNERNDMKCKKKRSRWADPEADKTFIPGMPTILPTNLSKEQEEAYLLQLQIEDVSRKLRSGDLGIPPNPEDRSPSPEPIYSHDGKRLNTREYRTRKTLEEERHALILRMQSLNTEYKPPADYKPPLIRVSDKVMIPQEDHPDINFVGLLIGPRGNTLKTMEKETGAKIIIRGKGSVKEGKVGRKDGQPLPGEDEPLHAYVTANNPEAVKKAVDQIKEVIRQGVEVPEGQNDLRRNQLRELALLNGTLREVDGPRCSNCGATDHKQWLCPDKPNVTKSIVCSACGGSGHIAKDCRNKRPGTTDAIAAGADRKIDQEYMSLMAELGEGPPPELLAQQQMQPQHLQQANNGGRTDNKNRQVAGNVFDRQGPIKALMAPENSVPPLPAMQPTAPPPWTNPANLNNPPPLIPPPPVIPPPMAMPPMWPQGVATAPPTQPPPPPPNPNSGVIPPLLPWLASANVRQPPPPGSAPPSMQAGMVNQVMPPWQQQTQQQQGQQQLPPSMQANQPPPPLIRGMYPPWQNQGYTSIAQAQPPVMPMGYPNMMSAPPPPPPS